MAIAFMHPMSAVLESLQALVSLFVPRPVPPAYVPVRTPERRPVWQGPVRQPPAQPQPAKPLRVVRVVEASEPRAVAGRMVISGRMADVCAELDRLAALEAR